MANFFDLLRYCLGRNRRTYARSEKPKKRLWMFLEQLEKRELFNINFPTLNVRNLMVVAGADTGQAVVARFTDDNAALTAASFNGTISWGDGATSNASIAADGQGGFLVKGNHTYPGLGVYHLYVSVQETASGLSAATPGLAEVISPTDPLRSPSAGGLGLNQNGLVANGKYTLGGSDMISQGTFGLNGPPPTVGPPPGQGSGQNTGSGPGGQSPGLLSQGVGGFVGQAGSFGPLLNPVGFQTGVGGNFSPLVHLQGQGSAATGNFTFTDNGAYSFTIHLEGGGGGSTFTLDETATISFTLTEAGTDTAGALLVTSYVLDEDVTVSYNSSITAPGGGGPTTASGTDTSHVHDSGAGAGKLDLVSFSWPTVDLTGFGVNTFTVNRSGTDQYTFNDQGAGFANRILGAAAGAQHSDTFSFAASGLASYSSYEAAQGGPASFSLSSYHYSSQNSDTYTLSDSGVDRFNGALADGSNSSSTASFSYNESGSDGHQAVLDGVFIAGKFGLKDYSLSQNGANTFHFASNGGYSNTGTGIAASGTFSVIDDASYSFNYAEAGAVSVAGTLTTLAGTYAFGQSGSDVSTSSRTGTDVVGSTNSISLGALINLSNSDNRTATFVWTQGSSSSFAYASNGSFTQTTDVNGVLVNAQDVGTFSSSANSSLTTDYSETGSFTQTTGTAFGLNLGGLFNFSTGSGYAGTGTYVFQEHSLVLNGSSAGGGYTFTNGASSQSGSYALSSSNTASDTYSETGSFTSGVYGSGSGMSSSFGLVNANYTQNNLDASSATYAESGTFTGSAGPAGNNSSVTGTYAATSSGSASQTYHATASFTNANGSGIGLTPAGLRSATSGSGDISSGTYTYDETSSLTVGYSESGSFTSSSRIDANGPSSSTSVSGTYAASQIGLDTSVYSETGSSASRSDTTDALGNGGVDVASGTYTSTEWKSSNVSAQQGGSFTLSYDGLGNSNTNVTATYTNNEAVSSSFVYSATGSFTQYYGSAIGLNGLLNLSLGSGSLASGSYTENDQGQVSTTNSETGRLITSDVAVVGANALTLSTSNASGTYTMTSTASETDHYTETGVTAGVDSSSIGLASNPVLNAGGSMNNSVSGTYSLTRDSTSCFSYNEAGSFVNNSAVGTGASAAATGSFSSTSGSFTLFSQASYEQHSKGGGSFSSSSGVGASYTDPLVGGAIANGSSNDGTYAESTDSLISYTAFTQANFASQASSGGLAAPGDFNSQSGTSLSTRMSNDSATYSETGKFAHRFNADLSLGSTGLGAGYTFGNYSNDDGTYVLNTTGSDTSNSSSTVTFSYFTTPTSSISTVTGYETVSDQTQQTKNYSESMTFAKGSNSGFVLGGSALGAGASSASRTLAQGTSHTDQASNFSQSYTFNSNFSFTNNSVTNQSTSAVTGSWTVNMDASDSSTYTEAGCFVNQTTGDSSIDTNSGFLGSALGKAVLGPLGSLISISAGSNSSDSTSGTYTLTQTKMDSTHYTESGTFSASSVGSYSAAQDSFSYGSMTNGGAPPTGGVSGGSLVNVITPTLGMVSNPSSFTSSITGTYSLTEDSAGTSVYSETTTDVSTSNASFNSSILDWTGANTSGSGSSATTMYVVNRNRNESVHYTENGAFDFENSSSAGSTNHVWGIDSVTRNSSLTGTLNSNGCYTKSSNNDIGIIISNSSGTSKSQGSFTLAQSMTKTSYYHGDGNFDFTNLTGTVNNTFTSNDYSSDSSTFSSTGSFTKGSANTSNFIGPTTTDNSSGTFSDSEQDSHTHSYKTSGSSMAVTAGNSVVASLMWYGVAGMSMTNGALNAAGSIEVGTYTEDDTANHNAYYEEHGQFQHTNSGSLLNGTASRSSGSYTLTRGSTIADDYHESGCFVYVSGSIGLTANLGAGMAVLGGVNGGGAGVMGTYTLNRVRTKFFDYIEDGGFIRVNANSNTGDAGKYHQEASSYEGQELHATGSFVAVSGGMRASLGVGPGISLLSVTASANANANFVAGTYVWSDFRTDTYDYTESGTFQRGSNGGTLTGSVTFALGNGVSASFGVNFGPVGQTAGPGMGASSGTYTQTRHDSDATTYKSSAIFDSSSADASATAFNLGLGAGGSGMAAQGTFLYTEDTVDNSTYSETGKLDPSNVAVGLPAGHEGSTYTRTKTDTSSANYKSSGDFTTATSNSVVIASLGIAGQLCQIGGALMSTTITGSLVEGTYTLHTEAGENASYSVNGSFTSSVTSGTFSLTGSVYTGNVLDGSGTFAAAGGSLQQAALFGLVGVDASLSGSGVGGTFTVAETATATLTYSQTGSFTNGNIGAGLEGLGNPAAFGSGMSGSFGLSMGGSFGFSPGGLLAGGFNNLFLGLSGQSKTATGTYTFTTGESQSLLLNAAGKFGSVSGSGGVALKVLGGTLIGVSGSVTGSGASGNVTVTQSDNASFSYAESGTFTSGNASFGSNGSYTLTKGHSETGNSSAVGSFASGSGQVTANLSVLGIGSGVSMSSSASGVQGTYTYTNVILDSFSYSEGANFTSMGALNGVGLATKLPGNTVTGSYSYSQYNGSTATLTASASFTSVSSTADVTTTRTLLGFTLSSSTVHTQTNGTDVNGTYTYDATGLTCFSYREGGAYNSNGSMGGSASGSYTATQGAIDNNTFHSSGCFSSSSSQTTVAGTYTVFGMVSIGGNVSSSSSQTNSQGTFTFTDNASASYNYTEGGNFTRVNGDGSTTTGSYTLNASDSASQQYSAEGRINTLQANGTISGGVGIQAFGYGAGVNGSLSASFNSNSGLANDSYTLTQTGADTYSYHEQGTTTGPSGAPSTMNQNGSQGSMGSGGSYSSTSSYTNDVNANDHITYTEKNNYGQVNLTLDETEYDKTENHSSGSSTYSGGSSSYQNDYIATHSYVWHEAADNSSGAISFSSFSYDETSSVYSHNHTQSSNGSSSYSDDNTSTSNNHLSETGSGSVGQWTMSGTSTYSDSWSNTSNGQTTSGSTFTSSTFSSSGTFNLFTGGMSLGWGYPGLGNGRSMSWLMGQFSTTLSRLATDLQTALVKAGATAQLVSNNAASGTQFALNTLVTGVQRILAPTQNMALSRTLHALSIAASPVGLGMPAQLTGFPTMAQQLETLSDQTTMFLNGFTFGAVGALREQSAALAKKYGDATYWVCAIAGAAAAVVAVIIGTILAGPELLIAMGAGAAAGFLMGVGRQMAQMLDGSRNWGDFSWSEIAESTLVGAYLAPVFLIPGVAQVATAKMVIDGLAGALGQFQDGNTFTGLFDAAMAILPLISHGQKGASEKASPLRPETATVRERAPVPDEAFTRTSQPETSIGQSRPGEMLPAERATECWSWTKGSDGVYELRAGCFEAGTPVVVEVVEQAPAAEAQAAPGGDGQPAEQRERDAITIDEKALFGRDLNGWMAAAVCLGIGAGLQEWQRRLRRRRDAEEAGPEAAQRPADEPKERPEDEPPAEPRLRLEEQPS